MSFSTGTGLERVGIIGLDLDCCWAGLQAPRLSGLKYDCCSAGLQALDVVLLCKNKKEGGRRGLRPWPLRCLCQFFPERKDGLLKG